MWEEEGASGSSIRGNCGLGRVPVFSVPVAPSRCQHRGPISTRKPVAELTLGASVATLTLSVSIPEAWNHGWVNLEMVFPAQVGTLSREKKF